MGFPSIQPDELCNVCHHVTPLHFRAVNPPSATVSPGVLWAKTSEAGSGSSLTLTCQAQDYHPSLPVTWKLGSIPYSNGAPPNGLQLQLTENLASYFAAPDSEFPGLSLAGDYYCEMWGYIPELRGVSGQAVVRFYGMHVKYVEYDL